jgi:Na+/H+ antiporter NhaA
MRARRRIEGIEDWLYVIIVASLALYLLIGVIAWTWMILAGIDAPGPFTTTIAAVLGALAGIVTPLQRPSARRDGE